MVLKRKEREEPRDEDFSDENDELDDQPIVPKAKQNVLQKPKQEYEAGAVEPIGVISGFKVADDEGKTHEFVGENAEALANCFGRIFKALKEQ